MLLRYRAVTRSPRHAQALLAGLAAGAVLTAAALVTVPAGGAPPAGAPLPAAASARATVAVPLPSPPGPTTATTTPGPTPTSTTAAVMTPSTAPAPRSSAGRTTRAPAPPAPAGAAPGPSGVVTLTNAERSAAGCAPLVVDPRLTAAAQDHAEDMATHGYFSHTGRDGSSFADRIRAAGHPAPGAENIARGQPDAATVVAAWMGSPGHRRNILDCSLTALGVGHDPRGDHWVQNFGR